MTKKKKSRPEQVKRPPVSATLQRPEFRSPLISLVKRQRIFCLILVAAGILRFGWLGHQDLWVDEMDAIHDAINLDLRHPLSRPHWLSFALMRLALRFGDGEFAVRFPSALAGTLSLFPMYGLIRRRAFKSEALVAAALLAFLPYHVHYTTEARFYGFVFFFSAMALVCLERFCRKASLLSVIGFAIFEAAAYLSHPASAPASAGAGLAAGIWIITNGSHWTRLWRDRFDAQRKRFGGVLAWGVFHAKALLLAVMLIGAAWSAYRGILQPAISHWDRSLPQGIGVNWYFFWLHFGGYANGRWELGWWPLSGAGGGLALLGSVALWKRRDLFLAVLFTSLYLVGLGSLFLSRAEIPYVNKYSIAIFPAFVGWVTFGICAVAEFLARTVGRGTRDVWAWSGVAALALLSVPALNAHFTRQNMPLRDTFHHVAQESGQGKRPCLATLGMANIINSYQDSNENDWLSAESYFAVWPRESFFDFLDALNRAGVPTWFAGMKQDESALKGILDGRPWKKETILPALAEGYEMLIYRALPTKEKNEPPTFVSAVRQYRRDAVDFDAIDPSWAGIIRDGDRRFLSIVQDCEMSYTIKEDYPEPALLKIYGRNRAEYPRAVEARLDGLPAGLVAYLEKNDEFTTRTLILNLRAAQARSSDGHKLTLHALDSTLPLSRGLNYADRFELDGFSIVSSSAPLSQILASSDSLIDRGIMFQTRNPHAKVRIADADDPEGKLAGWQVEPQETNWKVERASDMTPETLIVSLGKFSRGATVISPGVPIQPGRFIYGSLEMRVDQLWTHGANVGVTFYGEGDRFIGSLYAGNQPMHGNERWRRKTLFFQAPPGATSFVIEMDAWRNQTPARLSDGRIRLRDVELFKSR